MLHSGLGPVDLNEEDGRKPALPQVPTSQSPPSINLDVLLDFAIQQTFHELTVLSELLPKKKETDRKISVVQFAHSTRVIFVKLLAIVKWVKISKRFEPLSNICHFLDEQAKIFVNTADSLVELARTKLVIARLPVFQITQAVDVLTLGTYPRLPTCIKEYFIPETPLSHKEQAQTLSRLNKVIEYRLCQSANVLSPRIRDIKIQNGKVSLTVPGEFEAELTLLSPRANAKWCLLNVKILVEDYDIGYGTKLVHPLQVNFIHQLLQAKMDVSSQPLLDAYLLLHSFCQSLQLDLLYCQVVQMASTISPNMLQAEKYDPKEALLIVSYWLTKTNKKLSSQFRITISGDKNSPHTSLKVRHYPPSPNLPILDDDTGHLSINRLISETILIRCRERLLRLRKMLEMVRPLSRAQLSGNTVPTLKYMLFTRDHQSEDEALIISLNMFFGTFVCHVSSLGSRAEIAEFEKQLNEGAPMEALSRSVDRLRMLVVMERYRKAIAGLQVKTVNSAQLKHIDALKTLPPSRICFQFIRETDYYLVVTFRILPKEGICVQCYLFCSVFGKVTFTELNPMDINKSAHVGVGVSQAPTEEDFNVNVVSDSLRGSTFLQKMGWSSSPRQLQAAIATIEDRLIFQRICVEFDKRGIKYNPPEVEPVVGGLMLKIKDLSPLMGIACADFFDNLVHCCVRLDLRRNMSWPFECTMINCPLISEANVIRPLNDAQANRTRLWVQAITIDQSAPLISDAVTINVVDRLSTYCHLYTPVRNFSYAFDQSLKNHCSILAYTYHKLILAYGEQRNRMLVVAWKTRTQRIDGRWIPRFFLNFGQNVSPSWRIQGVDSSLSSNSILKQWNGHIMQSLILTEKFNRNRDLVDLVHFLTQTSKIVDILYAFSCLKLRPLKAISQLLNSDGSFTAEQQSFMYASDLGTIRLIFANHAMEFRLLADNRVAVRDAGRRPTLVGFDEFWKKHSEGRSEGYSKAASDSAEQSVDQKSTLTFGSPKVAVSPYMQPSSIPPQQRADSPMSSSRMTLSVPPSTRMDSFGAPRSASNIPPLHVTKQISLIDHVTLHNAMTRPADDEPSPLEDYLLSLVYISRLAVAMEACRHPPSNSPTHIPFTEPMAIATDSLSLVVPGMSFGYDVWTVKLRIYLCPTDFKLRAKLDIVGGNCPAESDILTFQRYFETVVVALSEYAVISFINCCRIASPSVFNAFAQIMRTEMDMNATQSCKVSLQLDALQADSTSANQRGYHCGVLVNEANKNILFMLRFQSHHSLARMGERQIMQFVYQVGTNHLLLRQPADRQNQDERSAAAILDSVRPLNVDTAQNECAIWPGIRALLQRFLPSH